MLFSQGYEITNREKAWIIIYATKQTTWASYEFLPLIVDTPWSDLFDLNQFLRLCYYAMYV